MAGIETVKVNLSQELALRSMWPIMPSSESARAPGEPMPASVPLTRAEILDPPRSKRCRGIRGSVVCMSIHASRCSAENQNPVGRLCRRVPHPRLDRDRVGQPESSTVHNWHAASDRARRHQDNFLSSKRLFALQRAEAGQQRQMSIANVVFRIDPPSKLPSSAEAQGLLPPPANLTRSKSAVSISYRRPSRLRVVGELDHGAMMKNFQVHAVAGARNTRDGSVHRTTHAHPGPSFASTVLSRLQFN